MNNQSEEVSTSRRARDRWCVGEQRRGGATDNRNCILGQCFRYPRILRKLNPVRDTSPGSLIHAPRKGSDDTSRGNIVGEEVSSVGFQPVHAPRMVVGIQETYPGYSRSYPGLRASGCSRQCPGGSHPGCPARPESPTTPHPGKATYSTSCSLSPTSSFVPASSSASLLLPGGCALLLLVPRGCVGQVHRRARSACPPPH